jgi:plasmid stabilization system protein ParE
MDVRWSLPAAEDPERICAWIERDNPEASRRVAKIIYHRCGQLKDFPNMGRASRRMSGPPIPPAEFTLLDPATHTIAPTRRIGPDRV